MMSNEEMVRVCLSQDEIENMLMEIPKRVNLKMAEISRRYPEGYWMKRQFDLKDLAEAELEAEDQKKEQGQEK
jgi:hypothetical protein